MSQRHRTAEVPLPPKLELRAHAHGERHRIHVELSQVAHQVSSGLEPDDVHEPGAAWKPIHHHDSEVAKAAGRQAEAWPPALEDQDVEAAHEAASGEGRGVPPRGRRLAPDPAAILSGSVLSSVREPAGGQFVGARLPLLDGDREPEVVLPDAVDLEEALGEAFTAHVELLDARAGCWCCAARCRSRADVTAAARTRTA